MGAVYYDIDILYSVLNFGRGRIVFILFRVRFFFRAAPALHAGYLNSFWAAFNYSVGVSLFYGFCIAFSARVDIEI